MWYVVAGLFAISVIVFVHEFGHFAFAKLFRMPVEVFCMGYGKPIVKKEWRGTVYGIGPFPFGGYCKIPGLDPREKELLPEEEQEAFVLEPYWKRVLVVFGGPFANIMLAIIIYAAVFMIGMPGVTTTIDKVLPNSPAAKGGLKAGDTIVKVDGHGVNTFEDVRTKINNAKTGAVHVTIRRQGQRQTLNIMPERYQDGKRIGIQARLSDHNVGLGFIESVKAAFLQAFTILFLIFKSLAQLITGKLPLAQARPVSPVGIVQVTSQAAQHGVSIFMEFVAFICVAIAATNLIPIYPLDGARAFLWTIELAARRRLPNWVAYGYQFTGVGLLLLITVIALYLDIFRALPDPFK